MIVQILQLKKKLNLKTFDSIFAASIFADIPDEFVDLWICGCGSRLGVIMPRDGALAWGKVGDECQALM